MQGHGIDEPESCGLEQEEVMQQEWAAQVLNAPKQAVGAVVRMVHEELNEAKEVTRQSAQKGGEG